MKKTMKKMMGVLFAMIMLLAMAMTASAATGTITITTPDSIPAGSQVTYKVYKVFDAVGNGETGDNAAISYKLVSGKTTAPTGFTVDNAGNVSHAGSSLTQAEIEAIADYVSEADLVATVSATGPNASATTEALPNGYYYISTTTGTVVTINSTNPNAEVEDKNSVPTVDKKITGASSVDEDGKKALAQIGTTVNYESKITVGAGAEGYVFHDTMAEGLTYDPTSLAITYDGAAVAADNYTVSAATGDTFTVTFKDSYLKTLTVGHDIVITYNATINASAVTYLRNTCKINYGENSSYESTPSVADVYNATIKVKKYDGDKNAAADNFLAGAGFVLKNADGKYYKLEGTVASWVDSIDQATLRTTTASGALDADFIGLANGTYKLEEKVIPAGYNKLDDVEVTIAEHDYTNANLVQEKEISNYKGSVLPSTGGMGTTLFYVAGCILVLGAGVVLIARKRAQRM